MGLLHVVLPMSMFQIGIKINKTIREGRVNIVKNNLIKIYKNILYIYDL